MKKEKRINQYSIFAIVSVLLALLTGFADATYKQPSNSIVKIVDAPFLPAHFISNNGHYILLIERNLYPPLSLFSKPYLSLAGLKINPKNLCLKRMTKTLSISILDIKSGKLKKINLQENSNIDPPLWSFDSRHFAFARESDDKLELFIGESPDGSIKTFKHIKLTNILGKPITWIKNNNQLLLRLVPEITGNPPPSPLIPQGPVTEETAGKFAKTRTYQNLLKTSYDDMLFEYYARCQLAIMDIKNGKTRLIGQPGLFLNVELSPDGRYLMVYKLTKPFSHKVTCEMFAVSIEIWDKNGKLLKTIAKRSDQEEVPPDGEPTGARGVTWQPLHDARIIWIEALDGGDPMKKAPFRDRIMTLDSPFTENPKEAIKLQNRFINNSMVFLPYKDQAIFSEYDRGKQWVSTSVMNFNDPEKTKRTLFERNISDEYNNPGSPCLQVYNNRDNLVASEGDFIYLSGKGATPSGELPFLSKLNIKTLEKEILFRSKDKCYEQFLDFCDRNREEIIIRSESVTEPPNLYLYNIKTSRKKELTFYRDPTPQLRAFSEELIKYKRTDGTMLSGTLYLPAGHKNGEKLPLIIWAYPLEYSDSSVAGQVRGSPYKFTFFTGTSPLLFLTQGYAVLYNAAMPVVGDPETKNNTFIEQIVSSAKAAIDYLDGKGIIDPKKVIVGGHSYGAFMTCNLLAHSRLFAAGIARSGAYNRTLTPFGFQNERRSFWEAQDIYIKLSPFAFADKIKDPVLLIHGQADDNPGTFTLQSERLYEAIKGNGGTARLVLLPLEGHGYYARESVLHVIEEMFQWGDRFVKNRK